MRITSSTIEIERGTTLASLVEAYDALYYVAEAERMATAIGHVQDLSSRLWEMVNEAREEKDAPSNLEYFRYKSWYNYGKEGQA